MGNGQPPMAAPEDRHLELSGRAPGGGPLRLHCRDWGGAGPPLLLLHGLASSCRIWDLAAPLLTRAFRVLALDQRGHGLSDSPDSDYTFEEVTADLAAAIAALEVERPVLAGHSWGAGVALHYAAEQPDGVRALVLVDGGFASSMDGVSWQQAERMMRPPDIDGVRAEDFLRLARNWPDVRDLWTDQLQEMVLSNFEVTAEGTLRRRLPIANHMKAARAIWEQRPGELWERLRCPLLLVPAIRQPRNAREELWLGAKLRGIEIAQQKALSCRVLRMEDTIHDVPLQRPAELARAIVEFAAEGRA